jgi:hypothetical protein
MLVSTMSVIDDMIRRAGESASTRDSFGLEKHRKDE